MSSPTFCTHSELNEDSLAQHCGTGGGDGGESGGAYCGGGSGGESGGDGGAHAADQPVGEKPFASHDFWQSSQPLPAQTALQLLEALRSAQFTKVASSQAQDAVSDGAEKAEQAICGVEDLRRRSDFPTPKAQALKKERIWHAFCASREVG